MFRRFIAHLLLLVLLTASSAALAQEDPVVVRVEDVCYTLKQVQTYGNNLVNVSGLSGGTLTQAQVDEWRELVIETFVSMGIMEKKYAAFGLEALTAEEEADFDERVQQTYDAAYQLYKQQLMAQYEVTEEKADAYTAMFMDLNGYTMDAARKEARVALMQDRLTEKVAGDVALPTDAEVDEYYQTHYVEPSRAAYANDISAFEKDVVYGGGLCYYMPAGYRRVRHILLPFTAQEQARYRTLGKHLTEANEDVEKAENVVRGCELLEEDDTEAKAALVEAEQTRDGLSGELNSLCQAMLERNKETLQCIASRVLAGEDFGVLIAEYSQDENMPEDGYPVCAKSVIWESSFTQGAMTLSKIGEISTPIFTSAGVHVLEYHMDVPAGAPRLTEETRAALAEEALEARKLEVLMGYVEKWRAEYEIETLDSLLIVPDNVTVAD